jgi:hypothetical protein
MDTLIQEIAQQMRHHVRAELLRLARAEEDAAADSAAKVQYWEPLPPVVSGHRECAAVLRRAADALDTTVGGISERYAGGMSSRVHSHA